MNASSDALTGGCLCGAVRYEARPDKREGYYCHCRMCQLATGNTRATWINLRQDQVTWHTPPTFHRSSKFALRGFCGRCGTPLTFAFDSSQYMDLTVGSFDDPGAIAPVSHYAIESRIAAWHVEDGLPGERLDASEKLAAKWKAAYGDDVTPGVEAVRKG